MWICKTTAMLCVFLWEGLNKFEMGILITFHHILCHQIWNWQNPNVRSNYLPKGLLSAMSHLHFIIISSTKLFPSNTQIKFSWNLIFALPMLGVHSTASMMSRISNNSSISGFLNVENPYTQFNVFAMLLKNISVK